MTLKELICVTKKDTKFCLMYDTIPHFVEAKSASQFSGEQLNKRVRVVYPERLGRATMLVVRLEDAAY